MNEQQEKIFNQAVKEVLEKYDYRIAPKKERGLVEQLRAWGASPGNVIQRAADRIEELESFNPMHIKQFTTDELLAEIARRVK